MWSLWLAWWGTRSGLCLALSLCLLLPSSGSLLSYLKAYNTELQASAKNITRPLLGDLLRVAQDSRLFGYANQVLWLVGRAEHFGVFFAFLRRILCITLVQKRGSKQHGCVNMEDTWRWCGVRYWQANSRKFGLLVSGSKLTEREWLVVPVLLRSDLLEVG